MQVSVNHLEWRILRQVLRTRKPSTGRSLRLEMNRRTKDGSFLTDMCRRGLLEVDRVHTDPFEATYKLTERGKIAADMGVYDVDFSEFVATQKQSKKEPIDA